MPLLAIADDALHDRLPGARTSVQLTAAVALPVALTALVVALCLLLDHLLSRDGASWLFDLPRPAMPSLPWRALAAVVVLAAFGVTASRADAIAGCPADSPSQPAEHSPGRSASPAPVTC